MINLFKYVGIGFVGFVQGVTYKQRNEKFELLRRKKDEYSIELKVSVGVLAIGIGYFMWKTWKEYKRLLILKENLQLENQKEIKYHIELNDEELNQELSCPISYELMTVPVIIKKCGHSFQRKAIVDWINVHKNCPICKKKCDILDLVINYALQAYVQVMVKKQNEQKANLNQKID